MKREKKFCPQDIFLSSPFHSLHPPHTHLLSVARSATRHAPNCCRPSFFQSCPLSTCQQESFLYHLGFCCPITVFSFKCYHTKQIDGNPQEAIDSCCCCCCRVSALHCLLIVSYPTIVLNLRCELDSSVTDLQNPARAVPSLQPRSSKYCHTCSP